MKRETYLKSLLAFLLLMVGANPSWADSKTIYPTKERMDRTNNATPTGWQNDFPKDMTSSGNTECEVKNLEARIWTLEQFVIPEIDRVKSITITYTRVSGQSNNGSLAIWAFPYAYPTDNTFSTDNDTYLDHVKTVLGVYPGNAITNNALVTTTGSDTRSATFDATAIAALKTAGTTTDGTLTVNLLLTTSSGTNNYKYYSINSSNEDAKKPTMVVEYYPIMVTVDETTTGYTEITSAMVQTFSKEGVAKDATIDIYDDVNMSNRIQVSEGKMVNVIPHKNLTITNTKTDQLSLLSNNSGRLNVGSDTYSITMTYNNPTITKNVIESSNSSAIVDLNNVIFSGISTNQDYGLVKASSGKVFLKNVTFSNCASTYATNASIIKCSNNDGVVFEGNNQFINCTGYDIFADRRLKVNETNGVNHTTAIKVYVNETNITSGNPVATTVLPTEVDLFAIQNTGYGLRHKTGSGRNDMLLGKISSIAFADGITGGTVTTDPASQAIHGSTVTITATPSTNYALGTITVKDAENADVTVNGTIFTMPDKNVTVSATFVPTYSITDGSGEGGSLSFSPVSPVTEGTGVTITVTPTDATYRLKSGTLKVNDGAVEISGTGNTYTFTMPAVNATVTAEFERVYTVTAATGLENGSISVDKTTAAENETVTVTTTPAGGYQLATLTYTPDGGSATNINQTTKQFAMPAANVTVTATFEQIPATTHNISKAAATNGSFTVSSETAAADATVTVTTEPASGYEVDAVTVTKSGSVAVDVTKTSDNTYTFTMPAEAVTVAVTFKSTTVSPVSIGATGYATLEDAVTAAAADATITINSDVTVNSAITFNNNLTIVPASDGVKILRSTELGNIALFTMGANVTVTIGSAGTALIIDGQSTDFTSQLISVPEGIGTLSLVNTTIQNAFSKDSKGIAFAKKSGGNGVLSLNGVTFSNCKVKDNENAGLLFLGSNDAVIMQGTNRFINCEGYNFYLEGRVNVADAVTTGDSNVPYTLYIGKNSTGALKISDGSLVVLYDDKNDYVENQFDLKNEGYEIAYSVNGAKEEGKLAKTSYNVISAEGITGGSLEFSKDGTTFSTSLNNATIGETITIKVTPTGTYSLSGLPTVTYGTESSATVTASETAGQYTFVMPAANVTVDATFTAPATGNVVNETQNKGYTTLAAAVDEIAENDVLVLNADISIEKRTVGESQTARITFAKNVTVKSAGTNKYVIKRGETTETALFKANSGKTITLQNIIVDDNNATAGDVFELQNNTFVLENVTIKNSKSSNTAGLIQVKSGNLTLTSITFENCAVTGGYVMTKLTGDNAANLVVNGVTFTSSTGDLFRLDAGSSLDASKLTVDGTISVQIANGTPVITNVADETAASKFTLATAGYQKTYDGTNQKITFSEIAYDYSKTFKVTGVGSFDTLADALSSENVADDATIIVQATEMTLDAQTAFGKSVTIVPDGETLTIKRATTMTGESDAVLFSLATADKTVTIGGDGKSITIDGQSTASGKQLTEVTKGTLSFINTTIKDVVTSNTQGVLCAKNSGTISLNGVTFNSCQATATNAGIVFSGKDDGIQLQGNISFTGCTGYNFFLEKRLKVVNTLTATGLTIFAKEADGGVVTTLKNSNNKDIAVVYGNADYYNADQFSLQNAGYTFTLDNKDLLISPKTFSVAVATGIENGTVTTDAADATAVAVGTEVTITTTPSEGYMLKSGSLTATYGEGNTAVTITDNKFKMPAGNVTITAQFISTTVTTTAKTIMVKDRVNTGGGTRALADGSKSVASTNSNNSIWYLGDVDMSKVHSITVKGAAFVNGTIDEVDTKAQLKLAWLANGTIGEGNVSSDQLSTNSSTIRSAGNLMAQITAQTTPTTVAEGNDATNYAGADFEITADGVAQTGTYDGTVTLDAENSKGLQKTDAVYQLFLYGTAQSRRLAVDEVIINYLGTSIPEGAYVDNTYEEPMTNVGQDTTGEPTASSGYTKETLGASADTYLRKGNTDNNGAKPQMEVYTYTNTESDPAVDKDFVGLLAFDLPATAKSSGAEIQKVQLRLVTKRLKGGREMNIYGFDSDFEESAKYADLESAVTAARATTAIHSFESRGQKGLDVVSDYGSLTSYNANITGWTNYFDLTEYAKNLSGTKMRLMLASPNNADAATMYYTKEAEAISNDVMTVAAAELVPQLIVVYKSGENVLNVTHPAMLHTADDIARVKGNLGLSPIREAYEHLQGSSYAQTSYTASPVEYLKRMDEKNWGPSGTYGQNTDYNNYTNAMKDAAAAYQLALRYQLEGSTASADAAVKILNDWATTNKGLYKITGADWANDIPDPNEYLILIQGHQFANAAELLRSYSGWNSTDFTKFQSWMKTTFSDNAMLFLQNHHNNVGNKHYWLNWDLAALTSVLSVGILCDDKDLTDYAINYYKGTATTTGVNTSAQEVGFYANAIPFVYAEDGTIGLGQCQESGRDQGHSLLDVALLGAFCQMAKNMGSEGADLFAVDDYRAVKMAEYVGKYNLGNDVEFTTYNPNSEYNHTAISDDGRGGVRPVWELFYRYARDNSKTAKYAQQWAEKLRAENAWGEGGAGDYGTNSNGFDQLGYGTLMYADPESADGQDDPIKESDYADYTIGKRGAQGDTYVRSTSANSTYGTAKQMEIHSGDGGEFAGLLSFNLPADAVGTIQKAQLRLVTKQKKHNSQISLYKFGDFDESSDTYSTMSSAVTSARSTTPLASFKAKGENGKDITSNGSTIADANKNLEAWTNRIDVTKYAKSLTGRQLSLLIASDNNNTIQFFTKEQTALETDEEGKVAFAAASEDLVPQLTIVYTASSGAKIFTVNGEGFATLEEALSEVADGGTILVTADTTIDSQVKFEKNVTIKAAEGVTPTLKRDATDKVLYLMGSNKTVTFENIVLDENGATDKPMMELNNSQHFVLNNVTIQNSKYKNTDGLLDVKNGTLTMNGVTFKDCAVTNAYIRTAKADGGGLDFQGKVMFSGCTGDYILLRGNASIDGAAVLTAIDAPVTIEINGSDYDKLSITNVTDLSKFKLTTDGFSMKLTDGTVTFEKEADGQDTDDLEKYDGTKSTRTPDSDTFVRSTAADTKYGTNGNMEIHTTADADFAGLLSFTLPAGAVAEGSEIQKVQLRLVTKQKKSSGGIHIFKVGDFSESDATYATMSESITAARATTAIAKFYPNGQNNMDLTSDGVKEDFSDDYRKLSAWENRIDLTDYVKNLGSRTVNLLLSASSNDGGALQFFTKEWATDLTSDGTTESANAITASASDLVPQLIVYYKADENTESKTFVIEGDGVSFATLEEALEEAADGATILVTADAEVENRVVFTKNVTIKGSETAAATRAAAARAVTRGGSTITRTLTRGGDGKQGVLYKTDKNVKVNFENIILDENNATSNLLEVANSQTFTLTNVTIKNSKSSSTAGVLNLKSGSLSLNDVEFDNCTVSAALIVTNLTEEKAENLKVNTLTTNNLLGSIFMIQNGATLDASQITGVETITFSIGGAGEEGESGAKTQIINVKDEEVSKYVLKTDGYDETEKDAGATTTLVFYSEDDGQDTDDMETYAIPEGMVKSSVGSQADNFVRNTNPTSTSDRTKEYIEVHTNIDGSTDFVGLLSFQLPYEAKSSGSEIKKVQVRLVTKQVKGGKGINVYGISDFTENGGTWNTVDVDAVRKTATIHKFQAKGEVGYDVTSDGNKISDANKNLAAWTNLIDLTDYAKGMSGRNLNLLLETSATDGQTKQFFSKERKADMSTTAAGTRADSGPAFDAKASDLVPQLIVVFRPGAAEPYTPSSSSTTTETDSPLPTFNDPSGATTKEAFAVADTYLRKNNTGDNGGRAQMEVYTFEDSSSDLDFVGLMDFQLPGRAKSKGSEIYRATLKLVTKRIKGNKDINVYPFGEEFEENDYYDMHADAVADAKKQKTVATFKARGEKGKDITTDKDISSTYNSDITAWVNMIDLTDYAKSLDGVRLRIMLASPDNSKDTKHFFTKEAQAFQNENCPRLKVTKEDLIPVLTVVYKPGEEVKETYPDGQDYEEITVPKGYEKNVLSPTIDTYVRMGNSTDNGKKTNMEVNTYSDEKSDQDFVGMMAFKLPDDLLKEGAKLHKAQLRLVSKRVKGSRKIELFEVFSSFTESAVYDQVSSILEQARDHWPWYRFQARGESNMDIESDYKKLSEDYWKVENWTNKIDMTELVYNVMHDDGVLRFALTTPVNANNAKQFYTKEAKSIEDSLKSIDADDLVPQLTLVYQPGTGASTLTAKNVETSSNIDISVRKGSTSNSSISDYMEVYTYKDDDNDIDFVGLLSFNLTEEVAEARTRAANDELEVFSATLRLVTKRLKGERDMNVYAFNGNFGNNTTYAQLDTAITAARESAKYVTFKSAGQVGKDVLTDTGLSGDFGKTISAWTNLIDVSDIIKDSDAKTLNLMLSAPDNAKTSKQYFSSEASSFANSNYKDFVVPDEDLVPLLIISYRNPLYTDIEETIAIPVSNEKIFDLNGNHVDATGKGVYIVNGKKVLKK